MCALLFDAPLLAPIFSPIENPLKRGFKDISNCSMLFIAYLVEEWIRRIEKVWRDGGGWWKLFRLKRQSSPPVFFTTSQPGTVINFLHLRFVYECCLDIRILFRACVMDDSIEMYELSSILQSLAIKSIFKVTSIEIPFQGNFWPLKKKKSLDYSLRSPDL